MPVTSNEDKIVELLGKLVKSDEDKRKKSSAEQRKNGVFASSVDYGTDQGTLTKQLGSSAKNFGSALNKATFGIVPALTKGISDVSKSAFSMFGGVFKGIGQLFVGDILGGLKTIFGSILSGAMGIVKGIFGVINTVAGNVFSFLKSLLTQAFTNFMAMQKLVGNLAADIGLSKAESRGLLLNFTELTTTAMEFGGEMGDIANMISTFSETTGKNKIFDKEDVKNIEQLGRGTALGVEGMTKMVAEFGNLGISMNKVFDLTEKARVSAVKLGINSKKVLDSYSQLVTGLTGFQMKSGLDNMVKLATQATQLRMDLGNVAATMSEKFFEPEGAVEAAAKMQVLGGQFGEKFGDAFELMYKAQVSPEEFTKDLMDMTKGLGRINENGMFYMPPATMQLLREATKTLPVDFKTLMNGAAEQAKLADKVSKLADKGFVFKDEDKTAIANLMDFDKDKGYIIRFPTGEKKALDDVNQGMLEGIIKQKEADDKAAKSRMNFTERLGNMWDRIQMSFTHVFGEIFDRLEKSGFLDSLDKMVNKFIGDIIPLIKKLFNNETGIGGYIQKIFDGVTKVVENVAKIFDGNGSFWGKMKSAAKELVVGLLKEVTPIIMAGFGGILVAMKDIPLIGGSLERAGLKMQLSAGKSNSNANGLLGGDKGLKNIYDKVISKRSEGGFFSNLVGGVSDTIAGGYDAITGDSDAMKFRGRKAYNQIMDLFGKNDDQEEFYRNLDKEGNTTGAGRFNMKNEGVDDALMTPGGRVFKGGKGDIGVLFDQAGLSNNSGGGSGKTEISHSGTITVKSEDGKEITINDLEKIGRYTLASYLDSLNYGLKNGNSLQNNEKMPITPISR